jgi:hypothetical protein
MIRPELLRRSRPATLGVQVGLTGVVDPNQTSLVLSGLAVDPAYPGSPVTCVFTVSHAAPIFHLEIFPATDTFTGAVVDDTTGNIVGLLGSQSVKLRYGQYTGIKLSTTTALPASSAGDQLTAYVGPASLMATATLGQPLYVADSPGVLSATIQAQTGAAPSGQGSSGGNSTGPTQTTSPSPTAPPIPMAAVAVVAGVGVVGVGYVAYRALSGRRAAAQPPQPAYRPAAVTRAPRPAPATRSAAPVAQMASGPRVINMAQNRRGQFVATP